MKKGKKGISLIVLVITIVVVIILAAAVLLTFRDGGIMDNAKKSKFMNDFKSVEEGVDVYSMSNIDVANPSLYALPTEGKLTFEDKQYITDNVPTLKTKIEELNPGKTIDDIDLYWINEPVIGANNIPVNKVDKGYIIDGQTRQIYDYYGDFFAGLRWHTLDAGVAASDIVDQFEEEMWDGWIRLTLYYPSGSTEKKWRLGSEGELRSDPMLMWQNYTGSITIPLDRVKDVWISYKLKDKTIVIPPAGTLLVDIVPDSNGRDLVPQTKVIINYDAEATTKEFRVGDSGWMPYTGEFIVKESCIIEARAKKTENVYDPDGNLILTRDICGNDKIYLGNIGTKMPVLEPPQLVKMDGSGSNEVAKVRAIYPDGAVKKVYTINYGPEINYTGDISIGRYNTTVIAYYYDAAGNRSLSNSIYIYDPTVKKVLPPPIITRLAPQNSSEVARVRITYPTSASTKVYTLNYGGEQNYTSEISVANYGTVINAYYYDNTSTKSDESWIVITEDSQGGPTKPKPVAPTININPSVGQVEQVEAIVNSPADAVKTYIRIGRYGAYQEYTGPVIVKDNTQIYAYYLNNNNEQSELGYAVVNNIVKKTPDNKQLPYVYINANPYPWEGTYGQSAVTISITSSYADTVEYSEDGSTYKPYTGSFTVTENKRIYARATNANGVSNTYLDITNIGGNPPSETPPPPVLVVDPSSGVVNEVYVSVIAPDGADKIYVKLGRYGTYQEYTSPISVKDNTDVYAYYRTYEGKKSYTASARITNIQKTGGDPTKKLPYVYIDAYVYPYSGTFGQSDVTITIKYADADKIEYSEDGVIYKPYAGPFKIIKNERVYARATNANGVTSSYLDITNIGEIKKPEPIEKLSVNILATPEPTVSTVKVTKVRISIEYDAKATEKYYRISSKGDLLPYTGPFDVDKSCTIYAYAKSSKGAGSAAKTIDNVIDGISDPVISQTPAKNVKASKVQVKITYDKYATIKRYSIDGGSLRDYTGEIEVTKNGTVIYAYSENVKGQSSNASYTVEGIVPDPPILVLDKGSYYLLKLSYPDGSRGQEYKWKENGEWKSYKEDGILLIKPEKKDQVIQNGTLVKIEDENGNKIDFKGDYYLIDVPISELFENIFMRWDRTTPSAPQIILNPTEPTRQVTATIIYNDSMIKKQYRILKPNEEVSDWKDYTGPITIDRNNTIIYAKGQDDAEVWSPEAMSKVTNIDEVPPEIKLTADLQTAQQRVGIRVNVTDDIAVGKVKWAPGTLGESYFANGGTEIANNSIVYISQNGYYTFCGEDKVGNRQVYTLNVTNVDLTPPTIDIQLNPENTFGITTDITINYGDSTIKQYKVGTNNTTWSNYTNTFTLTSNTVIANNWQNSDGTVTIYAKGKDSAGNEITVQRKIVNLDFDRPTAPTIQSNSGYAVLTAYGIIFDAETTITYDSRTDIDNYYSIDNGATWQLYTGKFDMTSGTVIAKSVKKNSGLEVSVSRTITMPADALKAQAYDKNDSTNVTNVTAQYMLVDSSMQGKNIRVKWSDTAGYSGDNSAHLRFLDDSKQVIASAACRYSGGSPVEDIVSIPANTKWIRYDAGMGSTSSYTLYEIQPSNEPTFSSTNGYMLLTTDPPNAVKEPYQMVTISYFPTSVQRLYRIGTVGDWISYADQPIWVNQGQTIYAKGIDQYGTQTRIISSYTSNVTDAMKKEVYDGNTTTYVTNVTAQYMRVDNSVQGKKINVRWADVAGFGGESSSHLRFLDENKQVISSVTCRYSGGTPIDDVLTVPLNTKWIKFDAGYSLASYYYLYEIQPSNEPVISATTEYMLLTADTTKAIRETYQMITISYSPGNTQKLYRIGTTGSWINYNNQPIRVEVGQTIYAKGIYENGSETRIISSYTAGTPDALKPQAYDNNDTTYVTNVTAQYMKIDSSMQGRNIRVKWSDVVGYGGENSSHLRFLDDNKQIIGSATCRYSGGSIVDDIFTIPLNTKWIRYDAGLGAASSYTLYEIQPSNEPTFSATNGYMLLTTDPTNAIKEPYQMITISYFPTSVQRLYQIGSTSGQWLNYNDQPIWVNQGQTIYAKGIDQYGNQTRIISSYTSNVTDAMKKEVYDGNTTTYVSNVSAQYIKIDESMQGKNINVRWADVAGFGGESSSHLRFLDGNKQVISSVTCRYSGGSPIDDVLTIPLNTKWIKFDAGYSLASYYYLYEIQPSNEPVISATTEYMLLTADITKAIRETYQMITISYSPENTQKLYRIGTTGNWISYNNQPIRVEVGQTIYAKGIYENGSETRIVSSYTAGTPDALKPQAYDNNDSTYITNVTAQYMKIDSSMQGKNIRVKWSDVVGYGGENSSHLRFLDDNKQIIGSAACRYSGGSSVDDIFTIPMNTKWIRYDVGLGSMGSYTLYEIQPSNEPTFSATNEYMLLAASSINAIKEPYQMITISYFSTSVQRLYQIGSTSGQWLNYNDQPIWVNQGQTIYAKGIDQYGNQTRIISSYTSNVIDAIKKEVYDGNTTTYVYNVTAQYMKVDEGMQGKNINVRWADVVGFGGESSSHLRFLDGNKQVISSITCRYSGGSPVNDIINIPVNTKWIRFDAGYSLASYYYLYEIQPTT